MSVSSIARLPLGLQTFSEVRGGGFVYVDKTSHALQLVASGKLYFLARPRRFGKSLFLDTLRNLFEGRRELFSGLHAEANWDWDIKYPVIKLDMSGGSDSPGALRAKLKSNLLYMAGSFGLELSATDEPAILLSELRNL